MKTAISLPDPLFRAAEDAARRLHVSRSQLYSEALREFLDARGREGITEALDRVYTEESGNLDPVLTKIQRKSLGKTW